MIVVTIKSECPTRFLENVANSCKNDVVQAKEHEAYN